MGEPGEIFGRRKTGEEFPCDAAISKLDVNGTLVMTLALRDITEQKRVEREQRFLADLGAVLSLTLDAEDTLANIARLAVRDLADLCIVDVVDEDGRVSRLKVMSRDPVEGRGSVTCSCGLRSNEAILNSSGRFSKASGRWSSSACRRRPSRRLRTPKRICERFARPT